MRAAVPRVTVIGGGNGISAVLRGLSRRVRDGVPLDVTAIVATADDGGSSGRLREERGGIPPGDLRNCLLALADDPEAPFARLFSHRYDGAGDLAGHSLGNLILLALAEQRGSYLAALRMAGDLLAVRGLVLPVSLDAVRMEGIAQDGSRISGESRIGRSHCAIERVWLTPANAVAAPGVLEALRHADLIVLGPGSLFTSLLAVLLVPGVAEAVRSCAGRKVLVGNLMTQPGETLGMNLDEHLATLERHAGPGIVDEVIVHRGAMDAGRIVPYEAQGAVPIDAACDPRRSERLVHGDVVTATGKIRHDPESLVRLLLARLEDRTSPA
jgi:uncharacterized cofD-like protein